jgi:hypothetical protein
MIRVNGELLDPSLVEATFSRIKGEAEARLQISCCERDDEFMTEAEVEVIDSILIAQEAERRHPEMPEDEVRTRLKETIELYRSHGASWDMLEAQRAQLREECAANLRMETLMEEVLENVPPLTEEDVRSYYTEHQKDYRSQAEVRCLHLMKRLEPDEGSAPPPHELLDQLNTLRGELLDGADFAEIAARETDKQDKEIDLDWIPLDRPTNPFESILFSMREGEISPVLSYEHAFHLIKVTGVKPAVAPAFEELEEELRTRAESHRRRTALMALATSLKEQATIEQVDFSEEGTAGPSPP